MLQNLFFSGQGHKSGFTQDLHYAELSKGMKVSILHSICEQGMIKLSLLVV
jgi:hypothetical protein